MKNILVPTDFSECSMAALDLAAKIARKTSGKIYLIHVIEAPSASTTFSVTGEWGIYDQATTADVRFMLSLMEGTKQKMEEIKNASFLSGVEVFDNIEIGSPSQLISSAADKYNADLILMGTHGTSGLSEIFIGSNAEKVVRISKRPVLTIKTRLEKNPNMILFATDFSEEADMVFPTIKKFASIFDASIHLLKVITLENFETTRDTIKDINDFLSRNNASNYSFTIYNDIIKESGIIHFAKDINANLIALGTHGRMGLAHLFNGSISEDLVNHAFCPVLTVNFHKK